MSGGESWSVLDSAMVATALFCAVSVAWVLSGRDGPGQARLLATTGAEPGRLRGGAHRTRRWADGHRWLLLGRVLSAVVRSGGGRAWWCLPAGAATGLLGDSWLPVVLGAVSVPLVARRERRGRARGAAERTQSDVIELCAGVAGELRCGRLPAGALLAGGADRMGKEGAALLAAARFGGDVPNVLQRAARLPGAHGLRGAAACWQVSADGGAGLADGLDRVAEALRAERDQRDELRSQLAGPRSTAAVLALLPVFGMLLGTAMGARPLHVLLHSTAGLCCLTAGCLLEWAGLAWVARLVRAAEAAS
ncbi:hypothetical protein N566_05115 [Streptomycetaceae bacterium MP113-05]|nr:hypothetical protein N566_05115 [Streptomycetaceae bacterium MP113-05]